MMVVFLIMLQSQLVKWEVLCLSCSLPLQDSSRVSSVRQSLKMGDANLVNGAQMGPCVVQEMAATKCPPRTWLAGWQSSWQESIYLYCPSWLLEVATALVVPAAQVLFWATKCRRPEDECIGRLSDRPFVSEPAKRFARNYHPIRDIPS